MLAKDQVLAMLEENGSDASAKIEDAKEVKICEAGFHLVSLSLEVLLIYKKHDLAGHVPNKKASCYTITL